MEEHARQDTLLLALTRPSLLWGVPIEGVAVNAVVTMLAGIILSAPVWYRPPELFWAMGVPVHYLLRRIVAWDFHGFRTIWLWLVTTGTGRAVLDSHSIRRPRSMKDIPSSV